MPTSDLTRTGLKPAMLFGRQRSGDIDAAHHQPPPRSPTLCPRRPGVANTPCDIDTGEIIESIGRMMLYIPLTAASACAGQSPTRPPLRSSFQWTRMRCQSTASSGRQGGSNPGREAASMLTQRLPSQLPTLQSLCVLRAKPNSEQPKLT